MAKLQIKSETIATFGGVFPIMDVFEHIGLSNLIDSTLGRKVKGQVNEPPSQINRFSFDS